MASVEDALAPSAPYRGTPLRSNSASSKMPWLLPLPAMPGLLELPPMPPVLPLGPAHGMGILGLAPLQACLPLPTLAPVLDLPAMPEPAMQHGAASQSGLTQGAAATSAQSHVPSPAGTIPPSAQQQQSAFGSTELRRETFSQSEAVHVEPVEWLNTENQPVEITKAWLHDWLRELKEARTLPSVTSARLPEETAAAEAALPHRPRRTSKSKASRRQSGARSVAARTSPAPAPNMPAGEAQRLRAAAGVTAAFTCSSEAVLCSDAHRVHLDNGWQRFCEEQVGGASLPLEVRVQQLRESAARAKERRRVSLCSPGHLWLLNQFDREVQAATCIQRAWRAYRQRLAGMSKEDKKKMELRFRSQCARVAKALKGDRVTGVVAEFLAAITFGLDETIQACEYKEDASPSPLPSPPTAPPANFASLSPMEKVRWTAMSMTSFAPKRRAMQLNAREARRRLESGREMLQGLLSKDLELLKEVLIAKGGNEGTEGGGAPARLSSTAVLVQKKVADMADKAYAELCLQQQGAREDQLAQSTPATLSAASLLAAVPTVAAAAARRGSVTISSWLLGLDTGDRGCRTAHPGPRRTGGADAHAGAGALPGSGVHVASPRISPVGSGAFDTITNSARPVALGAPGPASGDAAKAGVPPAASASLGPGAGKELVAASAAAAPVPLFARSRGYSDTLSSQYNHSVSRLSYVAPGSDGSRRNSSAVIAAAMAVRLSQTHRMTPPQTLRLSFTHKPGGGSWLGYDECAGLIATGARMVSSRTGVDAGAGLAAPASGDARIASVAGTARASWTAGFSSNAASSHSALTTGATVVPGAALAALLGFGPAVAPTMRAAESDQLQGARIAGVGRRLSFGDDAGEGSGMACQKGAGDRRQEEEVRADKTGRSAAAATDPRGPRGAAKGKAAAKSGAFDGEERTGGKMAVSAAKSPTRGAIAREGADGATRGVQPTKAAAAPAAAAAAAVAPHAPGRASPAPPAGPSPSSRVRKPPRLAVDRAAAKAKTDKASPGKDHTLASPTPPPSPGIAPAPAAEVTPTLASASTAKSKAANAGGGGGNAISREGMAGGAAAAAAGVPWDSSPVSATSGLLPAFWGPGGEVEEEERAPTSAAAAAAVEAAASGVVKRAAPPVTTIATGAAAVTQPHEGVPVPGLPGLRPLITKRALDDNASSSAAAAATAAAGAAAAAAADMTTSASAAPVAGHPLPSSTAACTASTVSPLDSSYFPTSQGAHGHPADPTTTPGMLQLPLPAFPPGPSSPMLRLSPDQAPGSPFSQADAKLDGSRASGALADGSRPSGAFAGLVRSNSGLSPLASRHLPRPTPAPGALAALALAPPLAFASGQGITSGSPSSPGLSIKTKAAGGDVGQSLGSPTKSLPSGLLLHPPSSATAAASPTAQGQGQGLGVHMPRLAPHCPALQMHQPGSPMSRLGGGAGGAPFASPGTAPHALGVVGQGGKPMRLPQALKIGVGGGDGCGGSSSTPCSPTHRTSVGLAGGAGGAGSSGHFSGGVGFGTGGIAAAPGAGHLDRPGTPLPPSLLKVLSQGRAQPPSHIHRLAIVGEQQVLKVQPSGGSSGVLGGAQFRLREGSRGSRSGPVSWSEPGHGELQLEARTAVAAAMAAVGVAVHGSPHAHSANGAPVTQSAAQVGDVPSAAASSAGTSSPSRLVAQDWAKMNTLLHGKTPADAQPMRMLGQGVQGQGLGHLPPLVAGSPSKQQGLKGSKSSRSNVLSNVLSDASPAKRALFLSDAAPPTVSAKDSPAPPIVPPATSGRQSAAATAADGTIAADHDEDCSETPAVAPAPLRLADPAPNPLHNNQERKAMGTHHRGLQVHITWASTSAPCSPGPASVDLLPLPALEWEQPEDQQEEGDGGEDRRDDGQEEEEGAEEAQGRQGEAGMPPGRITLAWWQK